MGLVALLSFLPILLLSPVAGVLADRYDRCLMMMIGDGMSGLGLVYILICMFAGEAGLYQICIGVFISAVFSSLLEPSYRAIVTDMLSKDEYSKASGMMSIAGSARYLISPMIAGFLLTISDVKLLIIIDICTFILTVICTAVLLPLYQDPERMVKGSDRRYPLCGKRALHSLQRRPGLCLDPEGVREYLRGDQP